MKKIILTLFVLLVCPSFSQDNTNLPDSLSSDIVIKLKIPKGWVQLNKNLFILKDYNKELNNWELNEIHI